MIKKKHGLQRDTKRSFVQGFFLLVHLSYLQAFIDVNKRTARLAANIPLVRHNLVPISFNDIAIDDYSSALISCYELNQIEPLAQLYVCSYLCNWAVAGK
jgi:Fic family protein